MSRVLGILLLPLAPLHAAPTTSVAAENFSQDLTLRTPHAEQWGAHRLSPVPSRAPRLWSEETPEGFPLTKGGKDLIIYGYLPYWELDAEIPWDELTHLAYFSVGATANGDVVNTHGWGGASQLALLAEAHDHGVRLDLVVTLFDPDSLHTLLIDPGHRDLLTTKLVDMLVEGEGDGINLDFEGLPVSVKAELVAFVLELAAKLWEVKPDAEISLATPAVDWKGAYDYDLLIAASDFLFIMCYGYHWSGGNPGPNAPLIGDGPFTDISITWTLDDYITWGGGDAALDNLVVGLPIYGHDWGTTGPGIPGVKASKGVPVTYSAVVNNPGFAAFSTEAITGERYRVYEASGQWHQVFVDNEITTATKVAYVLDQGVRGYGFWAIGYDGAEANYWNALSQAVTDTLGSATTPPIVADAGSSPDAMFLADIASSGDTISMVDTADENFDSASQLDNGSEESADTGTNTTPDSGPGRRAGDDMKALGYDLAEPRGREQAGSGVGRAPFVVGAEAANPAAGGSSSDSGGCVLSTRPAAGVNAVLWALWAILLLFVRARKPFSI